jgi:hypothetical protein
MMGMSRAWNVSRNIRRFSSAIELGCMAEKRESQEMVYFS